VEVLPAYHPDPFDRLLVAQAMLEELTIVTSDAQVRRYGVPTLAA
jgi:PIN domain nuclease of toxin-antitoxin system